MPACGIQIDALRIPALNLPETLCNSVRAHQQLALYQAHIRNSTVTILTRHTQRGDCKMRCRGHGQVSVEHTIPVSVWHSVANVTREVTTGALGSVNATFRDESWITFKSPINNSIVLWSGANVNRRVSNEGEWISEPIGNVQYVLDYKSTDSMLDVESA